MAYAGAEAARRFRGERGLRGPIPNLRALLRNGSDIVLVERPAKEAMDGAYAYDADLERGFMLINAKQFWTRRRFTMAHELGHHVLKHKSGVDRNVFEGTSPKEIAANAFAAELLMPEAEVRASPRIHSHDEIAELAAYFLVSGKAMIVRLESLAGC